MPNATLSLRENTEGQDPDKQRKAADAESDHDADVLKELRERYEYARGAWEDIRTEAETDMRFVKGDPWNEDDRKQRKDRPIIAPDELAQYRNQVINQARQNPRGMKFSPTGNGANDPGAKFYQNKAREIEYRSHGEIAYIAALENAIQRSYGFVSVGIRYASARAVNQDLWIDAFPNPDMVLPDPDALLPTSLDMKFCFELKWEEQTAFVKAHGGEPTSPGRKQAKLTNFGEWSASFPSWIKGNKVLTAIYWTIETRPRRLMLVTPRPTPSTNPLMPQAPPPRPTALFEDELRKNPPPPGSDVRELRMVDYPEVWRYLTNGLEILHTQKWPGKYIPIVSCYGPIYWIPDGGEVKRVIASMTRPGRDPWKAYCYACCQELEILGQIPKAPATIVEGQLAGHEEEWAESVHVPKAFLAYKALTAATGSQLLPAPQRMAYTQHEHLQAVEMVKEGYRRAIQASQGSNFMPTAAQQRSEKSGKALDKIEQSASTGTFHFTDHYNDMIQAVGVIIEDLVDKVHDYQGETGVLDAEMKSAIVPINTQGKDAVSTRGDYLVTVSTGPSSDSERDAVADFIDSLVGNMAEIAQIAGPPAAKGILARSIRLRNGGPLMDQIADLLDPQQLGKDGKPVPPELMAAQQKVQELTKLLQQAAQEKQSKVVEQQGKFQIVQLQEQAETERAAADRETKLAVAELNAKVDRLALFLEESRLIGARRHEHGQAVQDRVHTAVEATKQRLHERVLQRGDQQHAQVMAQQAATAGAVKAAIAARRPPANGNGA